MAVKVAGGILSSAILDISQAFSDQEGLILGEVGLHVENEIDDLQIDNRVEFIQYDVKHFVACPRIRSFYNKKGQVFNKRLAELTKGYSCQTVIGWYKSRHNSSHRMSYTEKLVTLGLYQLFNRSRDPQEAMPLFALFTSQHDHNKASIQIDYSFIRQHERICQTLPVSVQNLGKTMSQYKTENKSHAVSASYQLSLNKNKRLFYGEDNSPQSVDKVKQLADDVDKELQAVCRKVIDSENEIRELEEELARLKAMRCAKISAPIQVASRHTQSSENAVSENGSAMGNVQLLSTQPLSPPETGDLINLADDGKTLNQITEEATTKIVGSSPKVNHKKSTYERQQSGQSADHIGNSSESPDPSSSPVY